MPTQPHSSHNWPASACAASRLPSTGNPDSAALAEAVGPLHTQSGRCVLITDSAPREIRPRQRVRPGGRARPGRRRRRPASPRLDRDIVRGLGEIVVRTGDGRMSHCRTPPKLLRSADSALGDRQPAVFFDFDGTLSDIVDDPDTATLAAGAAEALQSLSRTVPGRGAQRPRPRRCPAADSPAGHLVCRQPRLRVRRTRR